MDIETLRHIWEQFVQNDFLDSRVQPVVAESWKKCKRYGLDPWGGLGKQADEGMFKSILAENKLLLDTALPIMQSVYEIVDRSHFLMVLTDSVGYVLETIGDNTVIEMSSVLRFKKGALWSDLEVGSNAIGIALDYDTAIQMSAAEHYCQPHHNWTCSAAPIHGINGEIVGCINMSGSAVSAHPHTLGLVVAAAFSIESQLSVLHSAHLMRTALEGSAGSIVLLNDSFIPIWANKAAEHMLTMSISSLEQTDFRAMMPDVDWNQIKRWDKRGQYFTNNTRCMTDGKVLYCSASISPTLESGSRTFTVMLKKQEHLIDSVNKMSGNQAKYTFESIYAYDPAMKKVVALAQKFARYDGSILIEGESGTGKELFAQAIHNASNRYKGPFVAVNCASLPRDLIESELFGYEKGAFTGALKEGSPGKFELANHGTLFLDEIGEMPLEFQAKLLRAVETLQIRRLGGQQERKLDVRVIAATNRNLRQESVLGRFRHDLYYRLNVLKLDIPPLRERPLDIRLCAQNFLDRFNNRYPEMKKTMQDDFLHALESYSWPGNVRELHNSIERTFYACGSDSFTAEDFSNVTGVVYPPSAGVPTSSGEGAKGKIAEISGALTQANGDINLAAQQLKISRATLYRRIKTLGIQPRDYKI